MKKCQLLPVLFVFCIFQLLNVALLSGAVPATINYSGRLIDAGVNFTGAGHFKFALVSELKDIGESAVLGMPVLNNGFLTEIPIISGGNGYTSIPSITITDPGGGSGASCVAVLTADVVTSLSKISAGTGYTNQTAVEIDPPEQGFETFWSNDGTSFLGSEPSASISISVTRGRFFIPLGDSSLGMDILTPDVFHQKQVFLRIWFSQDGVNFDVFDQDLEIRSAPYAILAQRAISADDGIPVGTMQMYAGNSAPSGWLICDGAAIDPVIYPELGSVLGETWGDGGDGVNGLFNLPDMRGRFPIGSGQGSSLTNRSIAQSGGAETHQLTVSEMPSHNHSVNTVTGVQQGDQNGGIGARFVNTGNQTTTSAGGNQPHNNMPPFAVVHFIIRAE